MTNPGEDAGQTASSGSSEGASEPTSTSYEAPPIEQTQEQPGHSTSRRPRSTSSSPPSSPRATGSRPGTRPAGIRPHAYQSPPSYAAPDYPQEWVPTAGRPARLSTATAVRHAGGFGAPAAPGYPPPPPYSAPPPGFGPPTRLRPPPAGLLARRPASARRPAIRRRAMRPTARPRRRPTRWRSARWWLPWSESCCGIGSIVGIVLGIVAMNQIKQSGEKGHGLAIAGIVVGVLSLLLNVAWTIGAMSS